VKPLLFALVVALAIAACGGGHEASPTPSTVTTPSPTLAATPTPAASPSPSPAPTATVAPTIAPGPEPIGFPIDPATTLGVVEGEAGSRQLVFGSGPNAFDYAMRDQPSSAADIANRSGWNCATHYEYEGAPAVDFYIPVDTPIVATMDGTATLNIISVNNDFDRYNVDREPYIGNPDRSRAPYSPFPGPSSGMGVYVHIGNSDYSSDYGHMDIAATVNAVPASAFINGYSPASDYASIFAGVPEPRVVSTVAQWDVHRGDVVGMSGDSGYSEGPHVHYQLQRAGGPLRCPTTEAGFTDGGWLFK
jgi:hypothetical protein